MIHSAAMGKVMTKVRVTNPEDQADLDRGLLPPERVRTLEVEALVDTGATTLVLPSEVCDRLGLRRRGPRKVRYANGRVAEIPWVKAVGVEILDREMSCDALIEAAGTVALIGQIPLEALDLHVDPKTCTLRVNPASPDMPLLDLLAAGS